MKNIYALTLAFTSLSISRNAVSAILYNSSIANIGYHIDLSQRCQSEYDVNPHFEVTSGSITPSTDTTQPLAYGIGREYFVNFDTNNLSTWRTWIDNSSDSTGPQARSLVEVTCDKSTDVCWADISNVDGLSNSWTVEIETNDCSTQAPQTLKGPGCASISCKVPKDWQCPIQNRFDKQDPSKSYPPAYLSADQSCVSNCTLKGSGDSCCTGAFSTPQSCSNQNPALKNVCPDAYSYAYDDSSALFQYKLMLNNDTVFRITACI